MSKNRLEWQEYFMRIAELVAERSTCLRRQVGAVAVLDKRILATGYNGVPTGVSHCDEVGCIRLMRSIPSGQQHELCRGLHSEQNVIIQAAIHGISLKGADLYCTHQPCFICAKMLINCGIHHIYFKNEYPDDNARKMLEEAKIPFTLINFEDQREGK